MLTRTQAVDLLDRHGLAPRRSLGQNFVVDPNTIRRIVRLAGVGEGSPVIEVGPGLGALTLGLSDVGADVVAIETDAALLPALAEVLAGRDVRVVHADALRLDWAEITGGRDGWMLVANLPYNVATPLVLDVLAGAPSVESLLVMLQREPAERLAAGPGSKAYGAPSVKLSYWATARVVGRVPPDVFVPRPRVESALVAIERRDRPAVGAPVDEVFGLIEAGFGQRRKMLRRALRGIVDPDAFTAASVAPEARAEELRIEDWGRLADAAAELGPRP